MGSVSEVTKMVGCWAERGSAYKSPVQNIAETSSSLSVRWMSCSLDKSDPGGKPRMTCTKPLNFIVVSSREDSNAQYLAFVRRVSDRLGDAY